jgi:DNA-binding MarR family transcriptional regulator
MESGLNPEQTRAIQDFMMFLGECMSQTNYQFEHTMHCSPEDLSVLFALAERSPLMVKEIARGLQGVSMSKLTRLLDQLEEQGYISRSLNLEDRRSFHVSLTEQGKVLSERLEQQMAALAENIMRALTPIERLLLVELFAKVRANWSADSVEQQTVQRD